MTEARLLDLLFAGAQPILFGAVAFIAFRFLRRLDADTERRHANPALRAGMALIGFSSVGFALILLRAFALVAMPSLAPLLGVPASVLRAAETTMLLVLVCGFWMLERGVRAVLYQSADGGMPQALRGLFVVPIVIGALAAVAKDSPWP